MPINTARGFTLYGAHDDEKLELIVWRSVLRLDGAETNELAAFVNQCPHMGLPLETFPDKFLSADGQSLICSAHGARFRFDGACFTGPCNGQSLHRVALTLRDGQIILLP
jgi:nitrite reductase/ring-hydroxylating ferredoxin subunit